MRHSKADEVTSPLRGGGLDNHRNVFLIIDFTIKQNQAEMPACKAGVSNL